jgi:hypothetical protein
MDENLVYWWVGYLVDESVGKLDSNVVDWWVGYLVDAKVESLVVAMETS